MKRVLHGMKETIKYRLIKFLIGQDFVIRRNKCIYRQPNAKSQGLSPLNATFVVWALCRFTFLRSLYMECMETNCSLLKGNWLVIFTVSRITNLVQHTGLFMDHFWIYYSIKCLIKIDLPCRHADSYSPMPNL